MATKRIAAIAAECESESQNEKNRIEYIGITTKEEEKQERKWNERKATNEEGKNNARTKIMWEKIILRELVKRQLNVQL